MEQYIGVKFLKAEEMTRGEFAEHKYHKEVNEGLPEDKGYLVEYEDGYQSWSPKDVFETAYRQIRSEDSLGNVIIKNPHQSRVYGEIQELSCKIFKLKVFIDDNPVFLDLDKEEQSRMKQQLLAMQYYLTILVERIENFVS